MTRSRGHLLDPFEGTRPIDRLDVDRLRPLEDSPSPSWPDALAPHDQTWPSGAKPNENAKPADTAGPDDGVLATEPVTTKSTSAMALFWHPERTAMAFSV